MVLTERIYRYVQELPESFQAEVLDFVEYLLLKMRRQTTRQDESDWPNLSLALAMRGMEDESTPGYSVTDLRETFS